MDYSILKQDILDKAPEFGFLEAKIANIVIDEQIKEQFRWWLAQNFHGSMSYLERNTELRFNPPQIKHGTLSIICVKAPYFCEPPSKHWLRLNNSNHAYISAYALGRDYHKALKKHLNQYAKWISNYILNDNKQNSWGNKDNKDNKDKKNFTHDYRVFTDSAPILEVNLAQSAGLGWRGKNTLLINKNEGSTFFLGEIFTNLPLAADTPTTNHCGSCHQCIDICPTKAFIKPYVLDARKCISYLTIENKESISVEFRKAIGNRIYGCDDCQLICPWNKFTKISTFKDFDYRHDLNQLSLIQAFSLSEQDWNAIMAGSAIYRIGYVAWLRNVAVALGNAPTSKETIAILQTRVNHESELIREHTRWALAQHISL